MTKLILLYEWNYSLIKYTKLYKMNNKIMIFPIDAKMVIFGLDLNLNKVDTQVIYCNQIKAIMWKAY